MKRILLLLFTFSVFSGFSQKTKDTIYSAKLKEKRVITVGLPPSYNKNKSKNYPLLFLMDGEFLFDPFQGALKYGYYWDDLPEVILIGLNQNLKNERESDCTVNPKNGLPEGKGDKFYEFLESELLPHLSKNYRIGQFRAIAGLDTTAGYLNFFLYKDNPFFNAFISLSPDLPIKMEEYIPLKLADIKKPISYYHCISDSDVKHMQKRVNLIDESLKSINNPNLYYRFDEFKNTTHYSLVLHAIPNALYHFFSAYQPISMTEFNEKIAVLPSGHVDYLTKKYNLIENNIGIKTQIRINDFKAIEAAILKNKAFEEFITLSKIAEKNYPKTMLSDYHMAMYYENTGDLKKASKIYTSAFQKMEIGDLTKDMMYNKSEDLKRATPR